MKKIKSIPLAASLTGLLFLSYTSHDALSVLTADDASVAAITNKSAAIPLEKIKLPEGFSISVYAEIEGARSMVMSTFRDAVCRNQRRGQGLCSKRYGW